MADAGSGRQRQATETGDFRIGEGVFNGVIARDNPKVRRTESGSRIKATILVGPWDSRQRMEREPPAFIRVKAFSDSWGTAYDGLELAEDGQRLRYRKPARGGCRRRRLVSAGRDGDQVLGSVGGRAPAGASRKARPGVARLATSRRMRLVDVAVSSSSCRGSRLAGVVGDPGVLLVDRSATPCGPRVTTSRPPREMPSAVAHPMIVVAGPGRTAPLSYWCLVPLPGRHCP